MIDDAFWTDRRLLGLAVCGVVFLGLMVATFLYACLQMPDSVQPCAVGLAAQSPCQAPADKPRQVACRPASRCPCELCPCHPNQCQEGCGAVCCSVETEVVPAALIPTLLVPAKPQETARQKEPPACDAQGLCCGATVPERSTCQPSKTCLPRGRLFRRRR